ncbi:AzlC family ABC transporter permease [Bacillus songklensis]|uniref:AzlC family ABC transporter permease n=1 Tax=Bacillus songklensis TaxID=1069116 RepID=A0ABV8AVX7_9BACI
MKQNDWKKGFTDALPIAFSFILFGGIFGMLSVQTGLSVLESVGMSLIVFAGSAQFTAISLLSDHASMWTIILVTFFINSRHLLMGLSMSPYYQPFSNKFSTIMAFFLIDEQYAITMNHFRHHKATQRYIMAVSFTLYGTWVIGTWLGTLTQSLIPDPEQLGLGFSFTALFLALVYFQFTSPLRIAVFILCGVASVLFSFILPYGLHLLAGGAIAFAIGYFFNNEKVGEQPDEVKEGVTA